MNKNFKFLLSILANIFILYVSLKNRITFFNQINLKEKGIVNNTVIPLPTHPYHVVDQSPWPLALSAVLLSLTISAVLSFHGYVMGDHLLFLSFILLLWGMGLWFKDIISESTFLGTHTDKVQKGISLGVVLFIISEVFFFLSIFWAYFHSSLAPAIEIGSEWPPKGIEPVNASEVPTANTTILLSSGSSVTVSHHSLVDRMISWANNGSVATIYLAGVFTLLQGMEYYGVSYTITDSVFGSTFYMGTGLINIGPIYTNFKRGLESEILFKGKSLSFNKKKSLDIIINKLKYNEYASISPYWITGFSDAESSFSIRIAKTTRKIGWRILPIFSIELHVKDLSLLKKIQSYFGVGSIIFRLREGRETAIYSVQSLRDINNVIIPHFNKYSLLSQKKVDYDLFTLIIDLINKKEHLNLNGISNIIEIKACMNKGLSKILEKAFPNLKKNKRRFYYPEQIINPQWLVGFVDGEGCYYIKIRTTKSGKPQISLVFSISQHIRDINLLKLIKDYIGCGVIEQVSTRPDSAVLVVYNFFHILNKILPFFSKNHLLGIKNLDFLDFYKVAYMIKEKAHLREEGINIIKKIKSKMNRGRI